MLPSSIMTFRSLTQAPSTFLRVLVARAMPCWMTSSKLVSETALIQEAFYRQIYQNDPRYTDEVQPLYARIERPVMIVWGEVDRWIPLEKGEQLHKAIPGSQLRTIPRCAHLAQEDAPEAVAEFLTDFFAP